MRLTHRSLLLGVFALAVAGCGSSSNGSSFGVATVAAGGTTTPGSTAKPGFSSGSGALAGTNDDVVATPSSGNVAVVVGASRTVSIAFTSSDGRAITGFGISGSLGTLPAGWSGPTNFACAAVTTSSGCVVNLTYTPTAVDIGTLAVNYVFINNATQPQTQGTVSIGYVATAHNNVVATASPTGQVNAMVGGGSQPVSVNFITDDGKAATNFAVTGDLTALPQGWSASATAFTCAIVSTGSGCELALNYAPTAAGGGTLTLTYSYLDDSGASKTGTLNIPYGTASSNTVVASAAPTSQIIAVQKTGGQPVAITFTTDDGKPASALSVTSNLKALPAGWSSGSSGFACGAVSTGNGCQLQLTYAPTALASGTLTLNYTYTDSGGAVQGGTLNLDYAATSNDNVVGTPSPSGQINAVASDGGRAGSGSQTVSVTFTTDDGRPATALRLTGDLTALPAGWSSTAGAFTCGGIDADAACVLPLAYAPTAAGNGTLLLGYTYENNANESKTGTVSIAYRATTDDNVAGTPSQSSLPPLRTGDSASVTVTFATDDGNPASGLSAALAALPAGWSAASNAFTCATVSAGTDCVLSLSYAPTTAVTATALTLRFSYLNDAGYPSTGSVTINYSAFTPI